MDINYFKEKIVDELGGAEHYIKLAIELRPMNQTWAKTFADMSKAELEHASSLFKMLGEYYTKLTGSYEHTPKYIEDCYKKTVECYTTKSAEIKYMHEMYSK